MYFHDTNLPASRVEVVDQFLRAFTYGTHRDDDFLRVRRAVIVERFVVCADLGIDHFHVFVDKIRRFQIGGIAGFSVLEESFRLLCGTHRVRVVRIQSVLLESLDRVPVYHFFEVFVVPYFDLLLFVRSTETIKEVQHRYASCDRGKMRDSSQIHRLLYRVGSNHAETGLTAAHDVTMVTKNIQCVSRDAAGGNVEHSRCLFTC